MKKYVLFFILIQVLSADKGMTIKPLYVGNATMHSEYSKTVRWSAGYATYENTYNLDYAVDSGWGFSLEQCLWEFADTMLDVSLGIDNYFPRRLSKVSGETSVWDDPGLGFNPTTWNVSQLVNEPVASAYFNYGVVFAKLRYFPWKKNYTDGVYFSARLNYYYILNFYGDDLADFFKKIQYDMGDRLGWGLSCGYLFADNLDLEVSYENVGNYLKTPAESQIDYFAMPTTKISLGLRF